MALTPEQIKELNLKYGNPRDLLNKKSSGTPVTPESIRNEIARARNISSGLPNPNIESSKKSDLFDKTIGTASQFLFGSTGKTVGSLITKGIGGAASIYGDITNNKEASEFGKKLQNIKEPGITDKLFTIIELYPGGGFVTNALKKIPGGEQVAKYIAETVPEALRAKAVEQYTKILQPTTNKLKAISEKTVPEFS